MSDWNEDLGGPKPGTPKDLREQIADAKADGAAQVAEKDDTIAQKDRAIAFLKAGIDVDSDAGALFARGYDGDLDPEAIKTAAAPFGLAEASAPTPAPTDTPLEVAEADPLASGASLSGTPPPPDLPAPDPVAQAAKVHADALAAGETQDAALGYALNATVNAAMQGDKRVVIPNRRDQAPA